MLLGFFGSLFLSAFLIPLVEPGLFDVSGILAGVPAVVQIPALPAAALTKEAAELAQGGSGDVLTGMLAALFAQQKRLDVETLTLMQLGVYLHGCAGQKAEAVCGPTAATARDVVEALRRLWEEQRS